jgi:hypothetical protein
MSTYKYKGATVEPRAMPVQTLFAVQEQLQTELQRRGWEYLREVGYAFYRRGDVYLTLIQRNGVDLVRIVANGEISWQDTHVEIDVPVKQFETLVPEATEAV